MTAILALVFAGCNNGDSDPAAADPGQHLIAGVFGSGATARPFYADRTASSAKSIIRAALTDAQELEGKIEDGDFAITLKGVYEETTGKFALSAMSASLGIGYALEGFIKGEEIKNVKAIVKTKDANGEWTETETAVSFDNQTQVDEQKPDDTQPGLPDAWTGLYPLPQDQKESMSVSMDAMFFGYEEETGEPNDTGLGVKLVDSLFFALTPWGFSLTADYDGIDAGVDQFIAEKGGELPEEATTADNIREVKKYIRMTISQMLAGAYFSFLEVEKETNSETRYAVAFTIVQAASDSASYSAPSPEAKRFNRLKISYNAGTLTMIPAGDLSLDEEIQCTVLEFDEWGNIVEKRDADGNIVTETQRVTSQGVAATADEARQGIDFSNTENQLVLTR